MTIERHYENRNRFKITKNEAIYMLLVLLIILSIFVFVLPMFAKNIKSDKDVSVHDGGKRIVKAVKKKNGGISARNSDVNVGGNKQSAKPSPKVKSNSEKNRNNNQSAADAAQSDIVFILDVSPSMMTKDDIGVRALVGIEWINQILQQTNSGQLYLLCLDNKSISEYMLGSKKSIPDSVTSNINKRLGGKFDSAENDMAGALSRAYTRLKHGNNGKIVMITDGYGMNVDDVVDVIKDHADANVKVAVFGVGRKAKSADYSTITLLDKEVVPYTNNDIFARVEEKDVYKDVFTPLNYDGLKRVLWALGKNGAYFSNDNPTR